MAEDESSALGDLGDLREQPTARSPVVGLQKRQARVTVKYRRAELQQRLDSEQRIERALRDLYEGAEEKMPELDIDDLLVLPSDEERAQKLQEVLQTCRHNTQTFIAEVLQMLHGLQKQEDIQKEGVEHPSVHSYPHHHHSHAFHHGDHHQHRTHQTL